MSTYAVWGWGPPEREPKPADLLAMAPEVQRLLGFPALQPEDPTPLPALATPRVQLPDGLARLGSTDPLDRARHGVGRSYRDLIRGIRGQLTHLPDVVVRPQSERDVAAVLDWAASGAVAVIPFGGGTSVVGGVEPEVPS